MGRTIRKIVIHCSDSPDTMDIGVSEIRKWHRERGWDDVGYHYIIKRNGRIEQGRPEHKIGAHVRGHNSDSIGICWVGRDKMSQQQFEAIHALIITLMYKRGVDIEHVIGHCELDTKKTCPNINMDKLRANLAFKRPGGINV